MVRANGHDDHLQRHPDQFSPEHYSRYLAGLNERHDPLHLLGTMPVAGLVGGALGQTFGVQTTMWVGGGCLCLAFLGTVFSPLRNMKEFPTETAAKPALVHGAPK